MLGGTLAAGAATTLPLLALSGAGSTPALFLLEANLLAECAAALLVSASSTWIRLSEARYRRVVGQVPVVLYSARIVADPAGRPLPEGRGDARQRRQPGRPRPVLPNSCSAITNYGWSASTRDDREILLAAVSQLARQQQPVSCEYRLVVPDAKRMRPEASHEPGPFPAHRTAARTLGARHAGAAVRFVRPADRLGRRGDRHRPNSAPWPTTCGERRPCSTRSSPTCRPASSSCRGRRAGRCWSTPAPANCWAGARTCRPASITSRRSIGCNGRTARLIPPRNCPSSRPCGRGGRRRATTSWSCAPTAGACR